MIPAIPLLKKYLKQHISPFRARLLITLFAGFSVILLFTAIFFCRKPVILVTDRPFNLLYGEKRIQIKQITLSLRLFRRIKTIAIAEGAGPDLAAQGAASLSRRPLAVFFPYRYREGARRYLKDRPGFLVIILAGRNTEPGSPNGTDPEPLWVYTDTITDLYRAGAFSGKITQVKEGISEPKIALYMENLYQAESAAFNQGINEFWPGNHMVSPNLDEKNLTCAVLLRDIRYNQEEGPRSIILFTWMDPAFAPRKTLALFDDSPWTQMGPVLDFLKKATPESELNCQIPSEITLFREGWGEKPTIEIKRIKTLKYGAKYTDNQSNL